MALRSDAVRRQLTSEPQHELKRLVGVGILKNSEPWSVDLTRLLRHTRCVRRTLSGLLIAALICLSATSAFARPGWKNRIDSAIGRRHFGVAVRIDGNTIYQHAARRRRVPASNQKLLLSMALLTRFGSEMRLTTTAAVANRRGSVVPGNLWLLGSGDPAVTGGRRFARSLPFDSTRLKGLAQRVAAAGVRRIEGRVVGSTGFFARDWYASGWKSYFPARYIPLPTALAFNGNRAKGRFVSDPEVRAARSFTRKLKSLGVRVIGRPGAKFPGRALSPVASIDSQPLPVLLRFMNVTSSNFFAEMLGKRLGAATWGRPGTIHKGARAIGAWTRRHGTRIDAFDASGLSYNNRVSALGIVRLLDYAEDQPWGPVLRRSLPSGGQGTLQDRLQGVKLRAKTGTLDEVSAISGWVKLERLDRWAAFSILSSGLPKYKAAAIEDRIVRVLEARARPAIKPD